MRTATRLHRLCEHHIEAKDEDCTIYIVEVYAYLDRSGAPCVGLEIDEDLVWLSTEDWHLYHHDIAKAAFVMIEGPKR